MEVIYPGNPEYTYIADAFKDMDPYKPPLLYNNHLFTLLFPLSAPVLDYATEILYSIPRNNTLPSFSVDWCIVDPKNPIVVMLPGLGGSSQSVYCRTIGDSVISSGYNYVVLNCRSVIPLTSPYVLDKTDLSDIYVLVRTIWKRYPGMKLYGIGCSIGGGMLANYITKYPSDFSRIMTINTTFDYLGTLERLENSGIVGRIYTYMFAYLHKKVFRGHSLPDNLIGVDKYMMSNNIWGEDYHKELNVLNKAGCIKIPLVNVQSRDDPCFSGRDHVDELIDTLGDKSPNVITVVTDHGGHLSYYSSDNWLGKLTNVFISM